MKSLPLTTTRYRQLQAGFAEWLKVLGYAPSSCYNLPNHLREFLHWLESQQLLHIDQLGPAHIEQYFHYLRQRAPQRGKTQLSPSYLNKHLQALRNFARYLCETQQGKLHIQLPAQKITPPQRFILTQTHIEQLYAATKNTPLGLRDRAMLAIYYGCGLRRNEGIHLQLTDVRIPQGILQVRQGKNYRQRIVPISQGAARHLEAYLQEGRPRLNPLPRETHFFLSAQGRPPQAQSLAIRLKKLAQAAGIEQKISLHSLRHAIATHLLQAGMKLEDISHFLGHRSLEATQIYTHLKTLDPTMRE